MVIIDGWMQHPSAEFLADPMFDSLRRWAHGRLASGEIPVEATVAAMDAAGVRTGMLYAWRGPRVPLIPNDAVAAIAARYPGRFAGVAAVDLARPRAGSAADVRTRRSAGSGRGWFSAAGETLPMRPKPGIWR
jgi:uncharacterized protein